MNLCAPVLFRVFCGRAALERTCDPGRTRKSRTNCVPLRGQRIEGNIALWMLPNILVTEGTGEGQ